MEGMCVKTHIALGKEKKTEKKTRGKSAKQMPQEPN